MLSAITVLSLSGTVGGGGVLVLFDGRLGRLRAMLGRRLVLSQARQMGAEVAGRDIVDDLHRVAGWRGVGVMEVGRQDAQQDQGDENRWPTADRESRRRSPDARSGRGRQGLALPPQRSARRRVRARLRHLGHHPDVLDSRGLDRRHRA